MKKSYILSLAFVLILFICLSFTENQPGTEYSDIYTSKLRAFCTEQSKLLALVKATPLSTASDREKIKTKISETRVSLKAIDFWTRYLEPVSYKKMNGPLPVEWETEVFEKFEKPYKREGAGLTLAWLYLDEESATKDSLIQLIQSSIKASQTYFADSITSVLQSPDHFFLCNRLYILNLAAIYTTGFECPDTEQIIPELLTMLQEVRLIYNFYNRSFPAKTLPQNYLSLFDETVAFVKSQPKDYKVFDHYLFIQNYVNPLFALNQELIRQYNIVSKSNLDYTLNKHAASIFSKTLYTGQNTKGVFTRVNSEKELAEIERLGKLLFYDPLLSGNNLRSCASCHKPTQYFTDTAVATSLQYNTSLRLNRNTPSLLNSPYNHLIMADGKHISLHDQALAVMTNSIEMAGNEKEILEKLLSCKEYKNSFKDLLKYTPAENELSIKHISSALVYYYSKFSRAYSPFDIAINKKETPGLEIKNGFNLFMGKAQCASCHFVPQFNGVKPPYVGSEFEVLGVPADTLYKTLSNDLGRYTVNPAAETHRAFRTGTIRNSEKTKPYMHNGVFNTLTQVIDFYDTGGGSGHGLNVPNQTLSGDSLHLSKKEKSDLLAFIKSLNENIEFEAPPEKLPVSKIKALNSRKVGGNY